MAEKKAPFLPRLPSAGEPARPPGVPRDGAPSPPSHATHAPPFHPPHRLAIQVFGQQNAQRHVGDSCCSRLAMILCAPRSLPRRLARRRRPHGPFEAAYQNGRPQFDALALFVKRRVSRFHPPARDGASFGHKHMSLSRTRWAWRAGAACFLRHGLRGKELYSCWCPAVQQQLPPNGALRSNRKPPTISPLCAEPPFPNHGRASADRRACTVH